jgi:cyclohexadienyl dehydratase
MKSISVVVTLAYFFFALPVQAQSPDRLERILKNGVLRVGTTMDTPVFSMRNAATGQLEGFDMDALETLSKALGGVKIEYVKMTFGTMLPDLLADKFDIAMSGMGRTLERARVATFSRPYMRYGKLMIIRSTDKNKYRTLDDLDKPGIKIAHNIGGLNERFAQTRFKRATPTGFGSNALAFADLLAGKVEAQVADSTSAVYLASNDPRVVAINPRNVFDPVYVAVLLRREDQSLLNFINIWLDQIEMEGDLARIRTKWLGDYAPVAWPTEPRK